METNLKVRLSCCQMSKSNGAFASETNHAKMIGEDFRWRALGAAGTDRREDLSLTRSPAVRF